jgi:hypothetical protein
MRSRVIFGYLVGALWLTSTRASAADFQVSLSGFDWVIGGSNGIDPPLTLPAGQTYTFNVTSSSFHPFAISTTPSTANPLPGTSPVTSGPITFTVPSSGFQPTLYYLCTVHGNGGVLSFVSPAQVPAVHHGAVALVALALGVLGVATLRLRRSKDPRLG